MAELTDWPWRHWARQQPLLTALIGDQQQFTWQTLALHIDALAAGFCQQGVIEGCGVVLRGKNSLDMLLAYLALLQLGARVLPLDPQLPEPLLAELLPRLTIDFGWSRDKYHWGGSIHPLNSLMVTPVLSTVPWHLSQLATLTLTSGSSGVPKAAAHTLSAHLASANGVLSLLPFSTDDTWLLSLPLFHISGQGIVWRWLLRGARLRAGESQPLALALQGCTHASLVPTQLRRLLGTCNPPFLKAVLLGGASIPVELTQQAEHAGIACWCGYGMTEMASTVSGKRADGQPNAGYPLPGREVRLVEGEIWLRGDCLAAGYWLDGKLQNMLDPQGWLHTRDRGAMHQGQLQILGRLDNLFFRGGEGIQPEAIEQVLLSHPAIRQAIVVPVPDVEFGQQPVAVLQVNDPQVLTSVAEWVEGKLARFQQPVRYFSLDSRLSCGGIKVSRSQVLEWVLARSQAKNLLE